MSARALGFGWQGGGTGSISGWAVASCEPSRPDTAKTVHKNAFLVLSGNIVISFLGKRVLRFGKSLLSLESRAHLLRLLVGRCEKKRCLRGAEQLVNKSVLPYRLFSEECEQEQASHSLDVQPQVRHRALELPGLAVEPLQQCT